MNSRALNKKIEIRGLQSVSNGFGGYDVADEHIGYSWAQIKSLTAGKTWNLSDMGLIQANDNVLITVRKRNDFAYSTQDMYFVYRGKDYTIASAPTNIDFDDRFITFIGSAANVKGNQAYGSELIINGDFSDGLNGWFNPSSHWQSVNDAAYYPTSTDVFPLEQNPATEPQKTYQLGFQLNMVIGTMEVAYEDENSLLVITDFFNTGFHQMTVTNPRYNTPLIFGGKSSVQTEFTMDNVSLKEKL